ncbi:hypothetical protein [Isoptericola sp. BMS4]|uniref:hypothetical protein n=1 Tax=Isoptericola sp. BMS4 TaxID=2527875 RepID=UPI001422C1E0|nr:hypothetical protein [Isoptericola sp. BMS4]
MSWEPLAAADPVPGGPDVSSRAAVHYEEVATAMGDAYRALGVIEDMDGFTSEAVEALRSKAEDVRGEVNKAQGRYEAVAGALRVYATQHREAQDAALELLGRAREAQDRLDAAEATASNAQSSYDDAVQQTHGSAEGPDPDAWRAKVAADGEVSDARAALNAVVGELPGIVSRWHDDAGAAAETISESVASDDLNDGWWEKWGSAVAGFVSKWAGKIAMWAGIAALVLGWVPILGQFLTVVAFVATVVALVADIALALKGEQPWTNAILGLIGAATFGVGRFAGIASKLAGQRGLAQGASRQLRVNGRLRRLGSPSNRVVAREAWARATAGFRSLPVTWYNPVSWFRAGIRSFSGLSGRAWILNFMGHGEAARGLQALQNVNAVPQFANRATGYVRTLERLNSWSPARFGSFGSVVAPYTADVVGNGNLLYRDSRTW